jgi:hypothetical protein
LGKISLGFDNSTLLRINFPHDPRPKFSSVHVTDQNALLHDVVLVLGAVESGDVRPWQMPETVNRSDSYTFCEQCGAALGHMLDQPWPESEIRAKWSELLA